MAAYLLWWCPFSWWPQWFSLFWMLHCHGRCWFSFIWSFMAAIPRLCFYRPSRNVSWLQESWGPVSKLQWLLQSVYMGFCGNRPSKKSAYSRFFGGRPSQQAAGYQLQSDHSRLWRQAQSASCRVATAICIHEILWRLAQQEGCRLATDLTSPDFFGRPSKQAAGFSWLPLLLWRAQHWKKKKKKSCWEATEIWLLRFCFAANPVSMLRGSNCYVTFQGGRLCSRFHCLHALVVLQFVTGLLRSFQCCGILSPEVRWFARFLGLGPSFVKWMGSFYTSMVLRWMVVSTSKVLLSWGRTFFQGLGAYCLRCSTERTLSGRSVSPAAVQFFWFHRFISKRHNPFCEFLFACFVPRSYSLSSLRAIPEQLGESPVCDVLEISESWPTMPHARSAMREEIVKLRAVSANPLRPDDSDKSCCGGLLRSAVPYRYPPQPIIFSIDETRPTPPSKCTWTDRGTC